MKTKILKLEEELENSRLELSHFKERSVSIPMMNFSQNNAKSIVMEPITEDRVSTLFY